MRNLTVIEKLELFEGMVKLEYQKSGNFLYRQTRMGAPETVLTIVSGKLETIKTAEATDIIMRNIEIGSSAEMYIIPLEVFQKRYEMQTEPLHIDGLVWSRATAKGRIFAAEYKGEIITFDAPWGEQMLCEPGDFIATPVGGDKEDVYRIEKDTFVQTYQIIS